jgi:hypothetical protein
MKNLTKFVLAVDPGKASGIALFKKEDGQDPELVWSGEYQQDEYAQPIRKALAQAMMEGIAIEIACERFTINAQTVKNSQSPYSLEQIGILKQCMIDLGMKAEDLNLQAPSDAKALFPNPALKKLGYWHKGGEGHALDAIRHGLLRFVKTGWHPVGLLKE